MKNVPFAEHKNVLNSYLPIGWIKIKSGWWKKSQPFQSIMYHNSSIVFRSYVCINNKSMPFNHPADRIRETMVASDCDSFSIFITARYKKMIFQSGHHSKVVYELRYWTLQSSATTTKSVLLPVQKLKSFYCRWLPTRISHTFTACFMQ